MVVYDNFCSDIFMFEAAMASEALKTFYLITASTALPLGGAEVPGYLNLSAVYYYVIQKYRRRNVDNA